MPDVPPPPPDPALLQEVFRLGPSGEDPSLPRHRHGLTREQVATNQRARIILATVEAVTERSYAKTVVRHIIEHAGVSTKTFYAHFADKEEAFMAAYTLLDGVVLGVPETMLTVRQPRTDLRTAVASFLQLLASWPSFVRMRFVEGRAAGPAADRVRYAVGDRMVDAMRRTIEEARQLDPRIDLPSDAVIEGMSAGIYELATRHVFERGAETLPELAPVIVELIERVLMGTPPEYVPGE